MDIIVGGIILLILGSSFAYVRKQLRNGNHCIGCSHDGCGTCPCQQEQEEV